MLIATKRRRVIGKSRHVFWPTQLAKFRAMPTFKTVYYLVDFKKVLPVAMSCMSMSVVTCRYNSDCCSL